MQINNENFTSERTRLIKEIRAVLNGENCALSMGCLIEVLIQITIYTIENDHDKFYVLVDSYIKYLEDSKKEFKKLCS